MDVYEKKSLLELLRNNTYAGRGIVIGQSADGKKAVMAYFIMGRSENSRNRIFKEQGEDLIIHPFDVAKVEDPSLIIYSPIKVYKGLNANITIVTNGDQTDTIYKALSRGETFEEALDTRCFEPDFPNYTPRISGIIYLSDKEPYTYKLNILKSADKKGLACIRSTFSYPSIPGTGHFISTYVKNGTPLPSFVGEPMRIDIPIDLNEFALNLWDSLNFDNKISLYVRSVDLETGKTENMMFNKHECK